MTRKKFIKSAMAYGYSRNWLDKFCRKCMKEYPKIKKENHSAIFTWDYQLFCLESMYSYYGYARMESLDGRKLVINKTPIQADAKTRFFE